MSYYDKSYYEDGISSQKSNYENYRWIPELTVPLAMTIIDHLDIKQNELVLDFGCAKGYLVKAFRWLNRQAYGYDLSEYALENADAEIKNYVSNSIPNLNFKYCIAKDVFEHIEEDTLSNILTNKINTETLFAVIPLGENRIYYATLNNFDKSHVSCHTHEWWLKFFKECGWGIKNFSFRVDGIKDKYYEKFPQSHGFFLLNK